MSEQEQPVGRGPGPLEIKAQRTIWIIYGVMAVGIIVPAILFFLFLDGRPPE